MQKENNETNFVKNTLYDCGCIDRLEDLEADEAVIEKINQFVTQFFGFDDSFN